MKEFRIIMYVDDKRLNLISTTFPATSSVDRATSFFTISNLISFQPFHLLLPLYS